MLRKMMKRVLFGKRKNYRRSYWKNSFSTVKSISFQNNRRLNQVEAKLNNLMKHLNVKEVQGSTLVSSEKEAAIATKFLGIYLGTDPVTSVEIGVPPVTSGI